MVDGPLEATVRVLFEDAGIGRGVAAAVGVPPMGGRPVGGVRPPPLDPSMVQQYLPKGFVPMTEEQKEDKRAREEAVKLQQEAARYQKTQAGASITQAPAFKALSQFLPMLGALGAAGGVLMGIVEIAKHSKIISTVTSSVSELLGALVDVILLPLMPALMSMLAGLGKFVGGVAKYVADPEAFFRDLSQVAKDVWAGIRVVASEVWADIKAVASGIWDGVKGAASGIWDGIKSAASGFWDTFLKPLVTGHWRELIDNIMTLFADVKTLVLGLPAKIADAVGEIPTWIKTKFQENAPWLFGEPSKPPRPPATVAERAEELLMMRGGKRGEGPAAETGPSTGRRLAEALAHPGGPMFGLTAAFFEGLDILREIGREGPRVPTMTNNNVNIEVNVGGEVTPELGRQLGKDLTGTMLDELDQKNGSY